MKKLLIIIFMVVLMGIASYIVGAMFIGFNPREWSGFAQVEFVIMLFLGLPLGAMLNDTLNTK